MDLFLDPASLDPANAVYSTYNMSTMAVVELRSLPRQIVGPNGREIRQNLSLQDLTPARTITVLHPYLTINLWRLAARNCRNNTHFVPIAELSFLVVQKANVFAVNVEIYEAAQFALIIT